MAYAFLPLYLLIVNLSFVKHGQKPLYWNVAKGHCLNLKKKNGKKKKKKKKKGYVDDQTYEE
jgi:hypothetical protein